MKKQTLINEIGIIQQVLKDVQIEFITGADDNTTYETIKRYINTAIVKKHCLNNELKSSFIKAMLKRIYTVINDNTDIEKIRLQIDTIQYSVGAYELDNNLV